MKEPIFVRALTEKESTMLHNGLRSGAAFTLRRCQMLLVSTDGKTPRQIASHLESVQEDYEGLQSFRNIKRMDAS